MKYIIEFPWEICSVCIYIYTYMSWLDSQKTVWLAGTGQKESICHVYSLQSEHTPGDG